MDEGTGGLRPITGSVGATPAWGPNDYRSNGISFDTNFAGVPNAAENRSASLSFAAYITY